MSKKTDKQSKKPKRSKPDDEVMRPPTAHSWQPLMPKTAPEEDLASILQEDFSAQPEVDADLPQNWPGKPAEGEMDGGPQPPGKAPVERSRWDELAALAETVFDTTFYLVPRMNEHYLLGELAASLREWLPTLCSRYGWELAVLSVRPDYLKWTLVDFPECLTRDTLSVVRRWTSERVFDTFPAMQQGNPSGDFWSPGYLVDTQKREFPTQVLIAHVSRSRAA